MPKNIVVFSDGTGQDGGVGNNTNVYSLFNMIEDRTPRQISFYDRGLGSSAREVVGTISGGGITRNIQECYKFISDNYNAGDQIYLIGFSRGATTVRTLSAFIDRFGILPKSRPELIQRAYEIYKKRNRKKGRELSKLFVQQNKTMWCKIRFLGVWDTVAALGSPFKTLNYILDKLPFGRHSYHDLRLPKAVEFARHAVAIDEERRTFLPTLWDERDEPDVRRRKSNYIPDICEADLSDIYLTAFKLRVAEDPVSQRIRRRLDDDVRELVDSFDRDDLRQESPDRIERLRKGLVKEFNEAIKGPSLYLCDPRDEDSEADDYAHLEPKEAAEAREDAKADRFAETLLTNETRDLIRLSRDDASNSLVRRLNRGLISDVYAFRRSDFPRVKQVWFAGMHSDVGGGYAEPGLAHIPLTWLVREAMHVGLLIYDRHKVQLQPNATAEMHNSRGGWLRFFWRRCIRTWDSNQNQGRRPIVHESVVVRARDEDCDYEPWILKMKYDEEPWPSHLTSSIQFDGHYIWRESFWGSGSAFAISWEDVDHMSYDDSQRILRLEIGRKNQNGKKQRSRVIEIKGSLPIDLTKVWTAYERHKLKEEDKRVKLQVQKLREQDEKLLQKLNSQDETIEKLRLELAELQESAELVPEGESGAGTKQPGGRKQKTTPKPR